MIIAVISALALGCALPAAMLVFGDLVNAFINQEVYMIILSRKRERGGRRKREKFPINIIIINFRLLSLLLG